MSDLGFDLCWLVDRILIIFNFKHAICSSQNHNDLNHVEGVESTAHNNYFVVVVTDVIVAIGCIVSIMIVGSIEIVDGYFAEIVVIMMILVHHILFFCCPQKVPNIFNNINQPRRPHWFAWTYPLDPCLRQGDISLPMRNNWF